MRRLAVWILLDLVLMAVSFVACAPLFPKEHPTQNENIARTLLGFVLIGLLATAVRRFASRFAKPS